MAADALVGHAAAGGAVPPFQRQHRSDAQIGQFGKDFVGGVAVVIIAHAGVVAAKHMVRAAQVLADDGVKDGLPRPGVAHIPQQRRGAVNIRAKEPLLPQVFVRQDDSLVNVIAHFLFADDGADQHPVGLRLQKGAFHQIFVAGMGDIARLMRRDALPSGGGQLGAQLAGRTPEPVKGRVDYRLTNQRNIAGDETVGVVQSTLHAGMVGVGRAVHLLRQRRQIGRIDFRHLQRRQRVALVSQQRGTADGNAGPAQLGIGDIQDDGDGPDIARFQAQRRGNGCGVGAAHKAGQRRKKPVGDIDALMGNLLAHRQNRQAGQLANAAYRPHPLHQNAAMRGKAVVNAHHSGIVPLPGAMRNLSGAPWRGPARRGM